MQPWKLILTGTRILQLANLLLSWEALPRHRNTVTSATLAIAHFGVTVWLGLKVSLAGQPGHGMVFLIQFKVKIIRFESKAKFKSKWAISPLTEKNLYQMRLKIERKKALSSYFGGETPNFRKS